METLRLRHIFSSHMVLQRERPIVLSGYGEPGKNVGVTFAGHSLQTSVGADGQWSVTFPMMNAGGPHSLAAWYEGQEPSVRLDDILIGEVWMCTGQSNMEMPVHSENPFWRTSNSLEELKNADHPHIRLFNSFTTRRLAPEGPLDDENPANPGWLVCNKDTVANFSACAYFFGRQLNDDLNVPVGLISTAWGGTRIEAWLSDEQFQNYGWPVIKNDKEQDNSDWVKSFNSEQGLPLRTWLKCFDELGQTNPLWLQKDFDDTGWAVGSHGTFQLPRVGRYVCRAHIHVASLPAEAGELTLKLGIVNDVDQTFLNGTPIGQTTPEVQNYWAAQRSYAVPAGLLQPGENVIAIIADNHYASGDVNLTSLAFFNGEKPLEVKLTELRLENVFEAPQDFMTRPNPPAMPMDNSLPSSPNYPSTLFNSLIHPWLKYAIRGTIWYQGCSNNGQFTYYPLHQMLIEDFRNKWNDPKQPFLIVQLAAFDKHTPDNPANPESYDMLAFPEFSPYGLTREIQQEVADSMDHVGIIAAFDCGDPTDIHPRDKQTLGKRLALKAEDMLCWIQRDCDGPTYAGFALEGNKIRVFFENAEDGLMTTDGQPPRAFMLGLPGGGFVPADAEIDGETVLLSSPACPVPQRIRYAFTGFCRVNLVNKHGLPAFPFRTDKPDYEAMFY